MSPSKAGSPTVTVKPDRCRSDVASLTDSPRTDGTMIEVARTSPTVDPVHRSLPAAGSVPSTAPSSASTSKVGLFGPRVKPATSNLFLASSSDFPTTAGTTAGGGPFDLTTSTLAAIGRAVSAAGRVVTTAPTDTFLSYRSPAGSAAGVR